MNPNPSDHDLLIRLDQKVENLTEEMRLMRDGSSKRLDAVEKNKLEVTVFEDFKAEILGHSEDIEKRVRRMEKIIYIAIGVIGFLQFLISVFKH